MSPITPEISAEIARYRQKSLDGTLTLEDMKTAILLVRQGRVAAQTSAAKSGGGSKAPKGPRRSGDDLLSDLGI